ncbi:MAG: hypothetical protein ABIH59_03260 [archaeon]
MRKQVFKRLTTLRDIIGNKNDVVYIDRIEEVVSKVEELGSDKGALIVCDIVPGGFEGRYYSWQNFLKRGPLVDLRAPRTIKESIESQASSVKLRRKAFDRLSDLEVADRIKAGYAWTSLRRGLVKNMVTLDDCLKGAELYSFCQGSRDIRDKIEIIGRYHIIGEKSEVVKFKVPSMSENKKYEVTLASVPLVRTKERYAVWRDLRSKHTCKIKENDFSFRYQVHDVWCPHEIAAYLSLAKRVADETGKIMMMPFALATESQLNFWKKLYNSCIREVVSVEKGKLRRRTRPLNKAEIEGALWLRIGETSHDETCWARKKIQDYLWN